MSSRSLCRLLAAVTLFLAVQTPLLAAPMQPTDAAPVTPGDAAPSANTRSGVAGGHDLANSTDALIVLSADAGLNTSAFCPMNCGDTNADGLVNSTDALIILSHDAGLSVPFAVGQPGCPATVTAPPGCTP